MNVYLVDYENVQASGLNGITNLSESDTLYILYSEHAQNLTFGLHRRLEEAKERKIKIEIKKAATGTKNALDFQLSSLLGRLTTEYKDAHFVIVSNDGGFKPLIPFWKKWGVQVTLASDLTGRNLEQEQEQLSAQVLNTIKSISGIDTNFVIEKVISLKTKVGIHTALQKEYKKSPGKASEIYKAIKPLLKDKKGDSPSGS